MKCLLAGGEYYFCVARGLQVKRNSHELKIEALHIETIATQLPNS
jgi:hypothetical protein